MALSGATVGPVVGSVLEVASSTHIGAGFDPLILILWQWTMCGVGALLGTFVEWFMNRGPVQNYR